VQGILGLYAAEEVIMQARGPLMVEHRVIEQIVGVLQGQLNGIAVAGRIDSGVIDDCLDFLRVYADRTHHGKEEDILFRRLSGRPLTLEHRALLEELLQEHAICRETTERLAAANGAHRTGDSLSLAAVRDELRTLVDLYPDHIAKEDRVFFPAIAAYLGEDEEQAMLAEFNEFDRHMIHEKYRSLARRLAAG
jgi:hemerythrin-like domain-containing protein